MRMQPKIKTGDAVIAQAPEVNTTVAIIPNRKYQEKNLDRRIDLGEMGDEARIQ